MRVIENLYQVQPRAAIPRFFSGRGHRSLPRGRCSVGLAPFHRLQDLLTEAYGTRSPVNEKHDAREHARDQREWVSGKRFVTVGARCQVARHARPSREPPGGGGGSHSEKSSGDSDVLCLHSHVRMHLSCSTLGSLPVIRVRFVVAVGFAFVLGSCRLRCRSHQKAWTGPAQSAHFCATAWVLPCFLPCFAVALPRCLGAGWCFFD